MKQEQIKNKHVTNETNPDKKPHTCSHFLQENSFTNVIIHQGIFHRYGFYSSTLNLL